MILTDENGRKFVVARPEDTEKQIIREMTELALERHGGNKARAAKDLGVARTALIARMKRWGLPKEQVVPERVENHEG